VTQKIKVLVAEKNRHWIPKMMKKSNKVPEGKRKSYQKNRLQSPICRRAWFVWPQSRMAQESKPHAAVVQSITNALRDGQIVVGVSFGAQIATTSTSLSAK
jgi:hypothetical protein